MYFVITGEEIAVLAVMHGRRHPRRWQRRREQPGKLVTVRRVLLISMYVVLLGAFFFAVIRSERVENPVVRAERLLEECRAAYRQAASARDSAFALKRVVQAPLRRGLPAYTCRQVLIDVGDLPRL